MKLGGNRRYQGWWLIGLQVLLLISLIWFGIYYHNEFEKNLTEKYRQQLSNTAATARTSVLGYFEKFSGNLVNLSHDPAIIRYARNRKAAIDTTGYCPLESLFRIHKDEIDALILMDTAAMVIKRIANDTLNFNYMMCIGNPRANPWVPKDSVYYSDIFINHKNQKAITLSCPVYDHDQRIGILRWMVTIESISNHFHHAIHHEQQVHFLIADQEGSLLSNVESYQNWLCANLCKCEDFRHHGPVVGNYHQLAANSTGKLSLMPLGCEVYAAWSSFFAGENQWKIMVIIPAEVLDNAMWKHGVITYGITAVALIIILSMTILYFSTRIKKSKLETEAIYLEQLAESQTQLKEEREKRLSAQIRGQELERQRISRELHDGLGQLLLTMRLWLKTAGKGMPVPGNEAVIPELLNETIEEVKRISDGLAPVMLMELGIDKALNRYCGGMAARSGIRIEYVCYGIAEPAPQEVSTHLFRIAQEAVTNAIRHANPKEINIQLLGGRDKITLVVQDDGRGFGFSPGGLQHKGNGIDNMRDRAAILNGHFDLTSTPGEGTTITVKIPLEHD